MAKAEKRALAAFLQSFGSELQMGLAERRAGQKQARAVWLECIMEGSDPDYCLNISGYEPEGEEEAIVSAERERQAGVERRAGLEEEAKEYTSLPIEKVSELGMPLEEHMGRATIRPRGTTIPMKREEVRLFKSLKPKEKPDLEVFEEKERIKAKYKTPKEPKVPYQVKEAIKGGEEREKEIKAYARDFRKAWYKRTQEVEKDKAHPITKEEFWRGWKEVLPKGDFRADLLAKEVAKRVGIKESKKRFYGASSYEEVETAVADVPEPEKSKILKQARAFFGVR